MNNVGRKKTSKKTNRRDVNRTILNQLSYLVELYPDLRFNQLLQSFDVVSDDGRFYEESAETLRKIRTAVEKLLPKSGV